MTSIAIAMLENIAILIAIIAIGQLQY